MQTPSLIDNKENAAVHLPPRSRKSMTGGKRKVSFGAVSVHEFDALKSSPAFHTRSKRRSFDAVPEHQSDPTSPSNHNDQKENTVPPSPSPSELSDVFFSPQESVTSSPRVPSLAGLVDQDESAEHNPPALSELLTEDAAEHESDINDDTIAMDMTANIGSIISNVAKAASPLQTNDSSQEGEENALTAPDADGMDMTVAIGGIKEVASAAPTPDWLRQASEVIKIPAEPHHPEVPPPEEDEVAAVKSSGKNVKPKDRRYSLSDKLQAVSNRLWRFTSTSADGVEQESNQPLEVGKASVSNTSSKGESPTSFDDFLSEGGLNFDDASSEEKKSSPSKALAGILGDEEFNSISNRLVAAMVLKPELDQVIWGNSELDKCIDMLSDGFLKMEQYIIENAPSFFDNPDIKLPPEHLQELERRCRQTARAFWYDWRVTLETDIATKLQKAQLSLEKDGGHVANSRQRLLTLRAQLDAATPAVPSAVNAFSSLDNELESAEADLSARELALARAEQQAEASKSAAKLAEAAVVEAREVHSLQQQEILKRRHSLELETAPKAMNLDSTLDGGDLLDSLHAAICWRPVELTSKSMVLRFRDCFELVAILQPGTPSTHCISSLQIKSLLPINPSEPRHLLLQALFDRVRRDLTPELEECRSSLQMRVLLQALSLRLGRILDLGDDIQNLAARVPVVAEVRPSGDVCLSLRFSFLHARVRFVLSLTFVSEDPNDAIIYEIVDWQEAAADSGALEKVNAACDKIRHGFGRLSALNNAMGDVFCPPRLRA